jgi:hypothetical protein
MYTIKPFNSTKPAFTYAEQMEVVCNSPDFITMMVKSKNIEEWNNNRWVIRDLIKRVNVQAYVILMGYIDNVVFLNWKR